MIDIKYEELKHQLSEDKLRELLDKHTYKEIQEIYGYNQRLISKLAKEYNIPKNFKIIGKNSNEGRKVYLDLEYVLYLYFELNKSIRQIAEIYDCNHGTISNFLKDNNIEIRSRYSDIYYDNRRIDISISNKLDDSGYRRMRVKGEGKREHKYVMEQYLGRKLNSEEVVHHIDFNKTNNNIENLFLFESKNLHVLYHGYIKTHEYIAPNEYLEYYEKYIKNTLDNKEWLYKQYITQNKSCNDISKKLEVSRRCVTKRLKDFYIYELREPTINQFY